MFYLMKKNFKSYDEIVNTIYNKYKYQLKRQYNKKNQKYLKKNE